MNEGGRLVWAMEGIGGVTGGDQLGTKKGVRGRGVDRGGWWRRCKGECKAVAWTGIEEGRVENGAGEGASGVVGEGTEGENWWVS